MERCACTFIGHSQLWGRKGKLEPMVYEHLERLITEHDTDTFLCGGMGEFDSICSSVVLRLKKMYNIRSVLVIPYMTKEINENGIYYAQLYDNIIRPEELMGAHYKSAITRRNRWMVDQSRYALCYVRDDYGGAYKTLTYAKKKAITIINLANENSL